MADRIAELETALCQAREVFHLAADIGTPDLSVIYALRLLGKDHGYGSLMVTLSYLWREHLGGLAGGEFVAGPCRMTVERQIEQIDAVMNRAIP